MKISSLLATKSHPIITINPEATLVQVVTLLVQYNIGALPVTSAAGELKGIISERDLIRAIARGADITESLVSDEMTSQVITGVPEDDVMSVANTMTEMRFRHLPILSDDQLIGIVSIGDLVKAQRDEYLGEIDTLETQLLANDD